MNLLQRAIEIAVEAHRDQRDKAGVLYVLHPLRVMLKQTDEVSRIVGVLHDVVEDCPEWTSERLAAEGFTEEILTPLRLVTKDPDADLSDEAAYMAFVARCREHPVARRVKRADIEDNLDRSRLREVTAKDEARLAKYERALALLG